MATESDRELKPVLTSSYFENSLWVRLTLAVLFGAGLFLFLHFREVRVDSLELDAYAPKFIVAQTDFSFLDQEATHMIRQDAVRDVGEIWRVEEKDVRNRRLELEKKLMQNISWRQELPEVSLTELFLAIDLFQKEIQKARFSDPKTIKFLEKELPSYENVMVFTPGSSAEKIYLPSHVWKTIEVKVFKDSRLPEGIGPYLSQYFEGVPVKLIADSGTTRFLRKKRQDEIPDRFTYVAAGDRIIDQGEKVQPRHLAMLQAMKKSLSDHRNLTHPLTILGSLILSLIFLIFMTTYLYAYHPLIVSSNRKIFLLATIILVTLMMSRGAELWLLNTKSEIADWFNYPLFIPLAAILICHLVGASVATFVAGFLIVLLAVTDTLNTLGMMVNIVASLVAIMETRSLRRRKEVFIVCLKAWLATVWVVLAIHLYTHTFGDMSMLADVGNAFFSMLLTAVLVIGLLPVFETAFQIMTDVTLSEYLDPSHELLRRLSIEAPGTYQHSLVVGSLSEAAALSIGANGLFCRVSTLYHDIGKMATPQYFTENQQCNVNMHQLLTPQESAQVIKAHVTEGVKMARKANLPEPFIDIIKEHHGTSLVYFFYRKCLDQVEGDSSKVDGREFRYAGPKPKSKESAIIMIADSFEAASRSLEEINDVTLSKLIEEIIQGKTCDRQLDDCDLTFHELAIIKEVMVQTLLASGHGRIKYPKPEPVLAKEF